MLSPTSRWVISPCLLKLRSSSFFTISRFGWKTTTPRDPRPPWGSQFPPRTHFQRSWLPSFPTTASKRHSSRNMLSLAFESTGLPPNFPPFFLLVLLDYSVQAYTCTGVITGDSGPTEGTLLKSIDARRPFLRGVRTEGT
jgi:hypothetical protein